MKLWTYDTCYEAAKKCSTKNEFRATYGSAYNVALKNKWLTDYTWFVEIKKPNGYWTYETCYQEAKKYTTKNDFRKMAHRAYSLSLQNDWINEYTWLEGKHKPSGHWTYDACYNEAKKYNIKNEFRKKSSGAYDKARKEGWLTDYTWFIETKKPSGYWTYETCYQEAKKYKTRSEFQKNCKGGYKVSRINNWIEDYTWLINGRIKLFSDKVDSVYVYKFENNTVYVGRTLTTRQKERHHQHSKDRVGKYAKQHHITMPRMEIIEENLTLKEGLEREDYWIKWFERQGYNILNKAKTGVGSGSLGAISCGKWNYETCYQEAKKHKTRGEFRKASSRAYKIALINGWINDYTWFVEIKKPNGYWTYEHCYKEAKKYKTRGEFQKNCKGAYNRSRQNGWINDYTWFVDGNEIASKERIKWTYDTCMNDAKKYKKIRDFAKGNSRAYEVARQHGWIDKWHWFKRLPHPKGYWDIFENVKVESEKYKTKQEFYKGCRGAYNSAVKHEWINILFN